MIDSWLENLSTYPFWLQGLILAVSTLGSEDLTTITAGMLVAQNAIHPITAILGCFLGIFVGDGLLYLLGLVVGRPAIHLPIINRLINEEQVHRCAAWFEEHGMAVVLLSRFLPGTRLPTYFAAGLVGASPLTFLMASGVAVAIWTPLLVWAAWFFGQSLLDLMEAQQQYKWFIMSAAIIAMFIAIRLLLKLGDWRLRARLRSRWKRFSSWEFWPLWLVYIPVVIYNLCLAVRFWNLNYILISNPGIENSGFVGESKNDIMSLIKTHTEFTARYLSIGSEQDLPTRITSIERWMNEIGLDFPLMMKPDVGQRGDGVQKVSNKAELTDYLNTCSVKVQVQEFLPGPHEFGISYRRYPWEEKGELVGLTGKEFPKAVGDGVSTLSDLILRNPMAQGRIHIFMNRFADRLSEVLPKGQTLELVRAGNHCLGTHFNDSSHLVTPEMVACVDRVSQSIPGFYIGRFDVRVAHLEDLRLGKIFKVMELNGSSAEPSYIYDPRHSIWFIYKTLFRHYRDLWEIGRYNAKQGVKASSLIVLWKQYQRYQRLAKGQAQVR